MSERLDELLTAVVNAPDTQIDASITKRVEPLIGQDAKVVAEAMKELLNDCVYASLASGFAINLFEIIIGLAESETTE